LTSLQIVLTCTPYGAGQGVTAQNMSHRGEYGNKPFGMHEKMMINGTINLEQTIFEAIGSRINTTLTQAITTAEQTTGNNSLCFSSIWWSKWSLLGIYNNSWYSWNGIP